MRIRTGAGVALLGLGVALAAGLFDAEALYVPGIGLMVLAAAAWAWVAAAADGAERGAGARHPARAGGRHHPGRAARAHRGDPPAGWDAPRPAARARELPLPRLGAEPAPLFGRAGTIRLSVSFARRGRRAAPPPVLRSPIRSASPAGSWPERGEEQEILVLPRIHPVEAAGGGGDGGLGTLALG